MLLLTLLVVSISAFASVSVDESIADLVRRVRSLSAMETPGCRFDSLLSAADLMSPVDAQAASGFQAEALALLREHPEMLVSPSTIERAMRISAQDFETHLMRLKDRGMVYGALATYWNSRSPPERAAELLTRGLVDQVIGLSGFEGTIAGLAGRSMKDAASLFEAAVDSPAYNSQAGSLTLALLEGIAASRPEDRKVAEAALQRVTARAVPPAFPPDAQPITARYQVGGEVVTTTSSRDSILFPLGVLTKLLDPPAFVRNAALFAPWANVLARVQFVIQAKPAFRERRAGGPLSLQRELEIALRDKQPAEPLMVRFLEAIEHGVEHPDDYALLVRANAAYSRNIGGDNASVRARTALAELSDLVSTGYDFELTSVSGPRISLQAQRGKVVLLNFWATWCEPCRQEMPLFEKLWRERGLAVLAVTDEAPDVVRSFVEQTGCTFPVLLDPDRKLFNHYRVDAMPATKIYDANGRLRAEVYSANEEELRRLLRLAGLKSRD